MRVLRPLVAAASVLAALALPAALAPAEARGSPWTLDRGRMLLGAGFDFAHARNEFLDAGGARRFPLGGRFLGASLTLSARLGITDRFELAASIPFRMAQYDSDPVILRARPDGAPGDELAFYQDNLVDFSRTTAAVGDIRLAGRYRWLSEPFVLTTELGLKTPTGYEGPEGTFGPEPTTAEAFRAQADELVRPENVRDDVTIGDGQLDLSASVLLGKAFSSGTFVRFAGGYRLRLGGAADQVVTDLRVGQAIGRRVLLYALGTLEYSIEDGDIVGITVVAEDPSRPRIDYARGENTRLVERPLAYDAVTVGGGLIWRLTPEVETNVSYQRIVWGRFVSATDVVSMSIALTRDLFED